MSKQSLNKMFDYLNEVVGRVGSRKYTSFQFPDLNIMVYSHDPIPEGWTWTGVDYIVLNVEYTDDVNYEQQYLVGFNEESNSYCGLLIEHTPLDPVDYKRYESIYNNLELPSYTHMKPRLHRWETMKKKDTK